MDLGSREEEMILSPVLRYGVRREEEIGARLSNEDIYELYRFDRQSQKRHASYALLQGTVMPENKKKGPARGESGALRGTDQGSVRRERSGRKGGRRKHPL